MRLLVEGENPWAIAWPCLHEFISVATNPKVFATHNSLAEAFNQISVWQALESCGFWESLLNISTSSGPCSQ
jgi:hypothetical protein